MTANRTLKRHVMASMDGSTPQDYLKLPYARVVVPESDSSFRSEILEFPGCLALGDTRLQALEGIEDAAESWLESALRLGQEIPPPLENRSFSGKLMLRIPRSLHRKAARLAEMDGVSLNHFIVTSLATQVGERTVTRQVQSFEICRWDQRLYFTALGQRLAFTGLMTHQQSTGQSTPQLSMITIS